MTFAEANKIAEKRYKKENILLYIFEIAKKTGKNKYSYIISEEDTIDSPVNCTTKLIKVFRPIKENIYIEDCEKYAKKNNLNFYMYDHVLKKYYLLVHYPTLIDYIKYNICLINSSENVITNDNINIVNIESIEEFCNRNKIQIFNGKFSDVLIDIKKLTVILSKGK